MSRSENSENEFPRVAHLARARARARLAPEFALRRHGPRARALSERRLVLNFVMGISWYAREHGGGATRREVCTYNVTVPLSHSLFSSLRVIFYSFSPTSSASDVYRSCARGVTVCVNAVRKNPIHRRRNGESERGEAAARRASKRDIEQNVGGGGGRGGGTGREGERVVG